MGKQAVSEIEATRCNDLKSALSVSKVEKFLTDSSESLLKSLDLGLGHTLGPLVRLSDAQKALEIYRSEIESELRSQFTKSFIDQIEKQLPNSSKKNSDRIYNDAGKALIYRLREVIKTFQLRS